MQLLTPKIKKNIFLVSRVKKFGNKFADYAIKSDLFINYW